MLLNNKFKEIHFRGKKILTFSLNHAKLRHSHIMNITHTHHTINNNNQYLEIRIKIPKLMYIKHTLPKKQYQTDHITNSFSYDAYKDVYRT